MHYRFLIIITIVHLLILLLSSGVRRCTHFICRIESATSHSRILHYSWDFILMGSLLADACLHGSILKIVIYLVYAMSYWGLCRVGSIARDSLWIATGLQTHKLADNPTQDIIVCYARAYIIVLFSVLLFVNKSGYRVSLKWLPLLHNFRLVRSLS